MSPAAHKDCPAGHLTDPSAILENGSDEPSHLSGTPMELTSCSYRMDVFTPTQSLFLFVLLYRHSFFSSFLHPSFLFLLVDKSI